MRVRVVASLLVTGFAIAGCAQKPVPVAAPSEPDPFGYRKVSAVCETGKVTNGAGGALSAAMKVRSDDGLCAIPVQQPMGGAYPSFLLTALPQHGKTFIHNYNEQTLIDYTPTTAYAGPDSFTVSLVPAGGGPRTSLLVTVAVDNTGVPVPPPPMVGPAPAPSTGTHHGSTTRHTAHTTKKRSTSH